MCVNPLIVTNPNFDSHGLSSRPSKNIKFYSVPCGWCLNCRVDRRNWLTDACNYEFSKFGCGAFVTFTYDDYHLPFVSDPTDNSVKMSLSKNDFKLFLYRLRSNIRSKFGPNFTSKTVNSRFKFLCVGEYGDVFKRPHYHCLFFGLDFLACKKIFLASWKNGLIDSLPIQNGGIRYVLKYCDKQLHGDSLKKEFTAHNLEAPFLRKSIRLGFGLLSDNLDFIQNNNFCYKSSHNLLRPIPAYYRQKFADPPKFNYDLVAQKMLAYGFKPNSSYLHKFSLADMNNFKHARSLINEKNLYSGLISSGNPADLPFEDYTPNSDLFALVKACR